MTGSAKKMMIDHDQNCIGNNRISGSNVKKSTSSNNLLMYSPSVQGNSTMFNDRTNHKLERSHLKDNCPGCNKKK